MVNQSFEGFDSSIGTRSGSMETKNLGLGTTSLSEIKKLNGDTGAKGSSTANKDLDFSDDIYGRQDKTGEKEWAKPSDTRDSQAAVEPVKASLRSIVDAIIAKGGGNSGQSRVKTKM